MADLNLDAQEQQRMQKLEFLLQRSGIYSRVMGEKLVRRDQRTGATNGNKHEEDEEGNAAKRPRVEGAPGKLSLREQPASITGAKLKPYQLEGLIWLTSLYENGLNGILADEMGLGKTLQTLAFLAHLREKGILGPFLIVAPLSTTTNWRDEFARFAPSVPVVLYQGSKEERGKLQKKLSPSSRSAPSVVITSYEIVLRDRTFLSRLRWKFVVVDEGHRLKNLNCRLLRELKQFKTDNRLILTGTPLHNNLAELWALLNFILPDIFDDLETFEQWFNLGDMEEEDGTAANMSEIKGSFASWSGETARRVVSQLHQILKPFLLRRVKSEVERDLPPKQEYLLYTALTRLQVELYNRALDGQLREWLIARQSGLDEAQVQAVWAADSGEEAPGGRRKAAGGSGNQKAHGVTESQRKRVRDAERAVHSLRLDNLVMQLRKICCHPYLLDWPVDIKTQEPLVDRRLHTTSGKLCMLDRLLDGLFARGNRVLIFTQFTTMLDILEIWSREWKKLDPYRIDGSTPQPERYEQVNAFNAGGDRALFLLSTRASGLGINLVGADTVIFYDHDWMDLQAQDRVHRIGQTKPVLVFRLVASDSIEEHILKRAKAKRQLEAVVIEKGRFRRPITHADMYAEDAEDKDAEADDKHAAPLSLRLRDAGNEPERVISDADLARLLDRSDEAYSRHTGWLSTDANARGARFEVTETRPDGSSEHLSRLLSGDAAD